MDLGQLSEWGKALLLVAAVLGVVVGFMKWILPLLRSASSDARAIRDTLVGREPQLDTITGREITPAIPGIGERMAVQEEQMTAVANAVSELAKTTRRLDDLDERVSRIEAGAHMERMASSVESIQLLKTIETVAGERPDDN